MSRLGLILTAALAVLSAAPSHAWAQTPLETETKADDLYKFGAFVEWPASTFDNPGAPVQICIAGPDPFGSLLDQAVQGQRIGGHPIAVMRLDHVDKGAACHILFVGPSPRQPVAEALDRVRGTPVLTVTDGGPDPVDRGMIDFVVREGHVRFRIDGRAAGEGGLAISSKLMALAVRPEGPP